MKHFVPLDVKTEKKFSPKIFMFDFFFIIGFAGFGWATQNIVIPALRTLYLVFCFAVGFSYLDLRKTIPENGFTSRSGFIS